MAEQFDVKLAEEAKYHTPRPEYREIILVRSWEEETRRFLKKEG
jgi:hypothetical protein